FIMRLIA
ncbi:hypothetical protein VCHC17A1_1076B, partial [Vibrio cholerae HC-17A1]